MTPKCRERSERAKILELIIKFNTVLRNLDQVHYF